MTQKYHPGHAMLGVVLVSIGLWAALLKGASLLTGLF